MHATTANALLHAERVLLDVAADLRSAGEALARASSNAGAADRVAIEKARRRLRFARRIARAALSPLADSMALAGRTQADAVEAPF